jgi:hypothetical protein
METPMLIPVKRTRVRAVSPTHDNLPTTLPSIKLHHGEAVWLMTQLGFRGISSKSTFYEYIKSLRKLGTPFQRGSLGMARHRRANYTYFHLMELALALTLRVYQVIPDTVLTGIIRHRTTLYRHYRQAYTARHTGLGAPILIESTRDKETISLRGVFLDARIIFSGGRLVSSGRPKLLSPFQALSMFAAGDHAARAFLPINLSFLSERVVALSLNTPYLRRGPSPRSSCRRVRSRSICSTSDSTTAEGNG